MNADPAPAAWKRAPHERDREERYWPWMTLAFGIAIALVAIAAFWDCANNGFVNWDDDRNFLQNESFRGVGIEQVRWAWRTYHLGVWQPAAWMLLGAEYEWFGLDPRGYHLVSVALHSLACAALFGVMLALLRTVGPREVSQSRLRGVAAVAALVFAVHPLRVEAVAWASCQPYLPSALFFLLAVGAYLRAWRMPARGQRTKWLAVCFACYVIAVLFKAVAVTLPAVLLILDWLMARRHANTDRGPKQRGLLIEKLPFIAVAIVVSILAARAKDFNDSRAPLAEFNAPARLGSACVALVGGAFQTVVPSRLTPYKQLPADISIMKLPYGLTAICLLIVTRWCTSDIRRRPGLLAAWLAYLIILLPNAGLIQISQQLTADRYSYLATMPLFVLLAAGLASLSRHSKAAWWSGVVAMLTACAVLWPITQRQTAIWHDGVALWSHAVELDPGCAVAQCNLGEAQLQASTHAEAEQSLHRAIEIDPTLSFAWSNLGVVQFARGDSAQAVDSFERALASSPSLTGLDKARTHAALGAAYAGLRKDDLAWKHTLIARDMGFAPAQRMIDYLSQFSKPPTTSNRAMD